MKTDKKKAIQDKNGQESKRKDILSMVVLKDMLRLGDFASPQPEGGSEFDFCHCLKCVRFFLRTENSARFAWGWAPKKVIVAVAFRQVPLGWGGRTLILDLLPECQVAGEGSLWVKERGTKKQWQSARKGKRSRQKPREHNRCWAQRASPPTNRRGHEHWATLVKLWWNPELLVEPCWNLLAAQHASAPENQKETWAILEKLWWNLGGTLGGTFRRTFWQLNTHLPQKTRETLSLDRFCFCRFLQLVLSFSKRPVI